MNLGLEKNKKKKKKKYGGIVVDRGILHSCVEAITRATRYRSSVAFTRWKLSAEEKKPEKERKRGGGRKKRDHFSTTIENSRQRIVSRTPRLLFPSSPPFSLHLPLSVPPRPPDFPPSSAHDSVVLQRTSFLWLQDLAICVSSCLYLDS